MSQTEYSETVEKSFTDEEMVHQVTDSDDFNNQLAAAPKGTLVLANFRTNW